MKYMLMLLTSVSLAMSAACDPSVESAALQVDAGALDSIRFLALGDSYTIGHDVETDERFPMQLAARLRNTGISIHPPTIIARTGWTTGELKEGIEKAAIAGQSYDIVTLLIGVNNQYRHYPLESYKTEFAELLRMAVDFAGGKKERVFVLSIPDYGVTPFGQGRPNADAIGREIDEFNAANKAITMEHGVAYIDITPISREAPSHPDLIAADGLHPSGEMYKRWVDLLLPVVLAAVE